MQRSSMAAKRCRMGWTLCPSMAMAFASGGSTSPPNSSAICCRHLGRWLVPTDDGVMRYVAWPAGDSVRSWLDLWPVRTIRTQLVGLSVCHRASRTHQPAMRSPRANKPCGKSEFYPTSARTIGEFGFRPRCQVAGAIHAEQLSDVAIGRHSGRRRRRHPSTAAANRSAPSAWPASCWPVTIGPCAVLPSLRQWIRSYTTERNA